MTIGIQQDQGTVNATSGQIALDLERIMVEIEHFQQFLNGTVDATLQASPYNFSAGDIAILKSAFGDLFGLAQIYRGILANGTVKDYSQFAKLLRGGSYF